MGYKRGTAKLGRLITFEASATCYNVLVMDGVNGMSIVADAEGRWIAPVPRNHLDNVSQLEYYLKKSGRSEVDAHNIALAIVADVFDRG